MNIPRWHNAFMAQTARPEIIVGIDAGGSSISSQAVRSGSVVGWGRSGPANAMTTESSTLERNLIHALAGLPDPNRVAGCFAGMSNPSVRRLVHGIIQRRFPGAEIRLVPDYLATLMANVNADVCVVAGTGSVCCSIVGGRVRVSGGRGYLIGDHGSAFRYGQALLEFALERDESCLAPPLREAIVQVFGTLDRRQIVAAVHSSPTPAALLGQLSRPLGDCADDFEGWAVSLVEEEAERLARTVGHHVDRYLPDRSSLVVVLAGGVWHSRAITREFRGALTRLLRPTSVSVRRSEHEPILGAVRVAQLSEEEFQNLVD